MSKKFQPQPHEHCDHCCECESCVGSRALHEAVDTLSTLAYALGINEDKPDVEWARRTMDDLDSERVINGAYEAIDRYDELRKADHR